MAEQFADYVHTTLSASMTSGSTSLSVTSATGFPSAAPFRVRIEDATNGDEIVLVTAGAGTTTWTVTRGQEGTTAVSHVSGCNVHHVLTAAGLVAAGGQRAPAFTVDPPAAVADWSRLDATSATLADITAAVVLNASSVSGMAVAYRSAPATPYHVELAIAPLLLGGSTPWVAGCFVDETNKKIHTVSYQYISGGSNRKLNISKYTINPDSWVADYANIDASMLHSAGGLLWFRFGDDGTTNRTIDISGDGMTWFNIHTVARADFLTPSSIGIGASRGSTAGAAIATCVHYRVTA